LTIILSRILELDHSIVCVVEGRTDAPILVIVLAAGRDTVAGVTGCLEGAAQLSDVVA
jgi:hypothetical protein